MLGLCACVQAFPYDVPEFVPQILMDLSEHLNDPQMIQVTGDAKNIMLAYHFLLLLWLIQ